LPILQRIHRATRHAGKVPRRGVDLPHGPATNLLDLRQQFRRAVETEDYEQAAALRDLIRQKEASDEPG
jgi:protein arginine kinase activator